jgi:hypothetical protein
MNLKNGLFNNFNNHLAWVEINRIRKFINKFLKVWQSGKVNSGHSFKYSLFSCQVLVDPCRPDLGGQTDSNLTSLAAKQFLHQKKNCWYSS